MPTPPDPNRKRKKTGGRKTGTPNKRTPVGDIHEARRIMEKAGFCPIQAMIDIYNDVKDSQTTVALQAAKELAKYHSPQLAAQQVTHGSEGGGINITVQTRSDTPLPPTSQ